MRARHNVSGSLPSPSVTPHTPSDPRKRWQMARELTGLLLLVAGLTGGVTLLGSIDMRLVVAVACIAAIAIGAALTMSKE